jgi:enoyl-CoA hydratase
MAYQTIRYDIVGPIACITLDRPDELNTIVPPMPDEIEAAVNGAVADPDVKVIIVRGAGRSFCAGFNFGGGFHHWGAGLRTDGQ